MYELANNPKSLQQQVSVISQEWDNIFDNLDCADGKNDGKINRKSLILWLGTMDFQKQIDCEKHLNVQPKEIRRLVSKVDADKDGLIDKQEFLDLVQNKSDVLSKQQQNVMRQYLKVGIYSQVCSCCANHES